MSTSQIQVTGLKELQRALKRFDVEFPKQLRGRLKVIAERVAGIVRGRLPHLTGKMISKTKASSTTKGAGIAWRGVPYAGPIEFGGYPKAGAGGTGVAYVAKGRYIYPTVDAERSQIEAEISVIVDEYIERAGLG